jgi:malate dehydrogenase (oxaloacetate-decarboxylating)
VIQWEDLAKDTAFTVLDRHKDAPTFNDDIQGTGAVALAGMLRACASRGERLRDQRVVIHGAGAGGIGVADAIRRGMIDDGAAPSDAAANVFVLDSRGLLVDDRALEDYKRTFAQPRARIAEWGVTGAADAAAPVRSLTRGGVPDLLTVVEKARPTALLGLSGQPRAFSELVIRALARQVDRPIVFALSNPTTSCEASPADVLAWTSGRALVATGSPFGPVDGARIGQGNNAFVFPGLGQGAILAGVTRVTDGMVMTAAHAVASYTAAHHPEAIFPPVSELPRVSREVATAVLERAHADGVASLPPPANPRAFVEHTAWRPRYMKVRKAR